MSVLYTFDADLDTVLQAASNEDLDPLVEFIQQAQISEKFVMWPSTLSCNLMRKLLCQQSSVSSSPM